MPSPCTPRRVTQRKQPSKLLLLQAHLSTPTSPPPPPPPHSTSPSAPSPSPSPPPPSLPPASLPLNIESPTGPRAIPSASLFCSPPRDHFRTPFPSHTPPITITPPSPNEWHRKSTGTRLSSPPRPSFVPQTASSQHYLEYPPQLGHSKSPTPQQLAPSSPLGRGLRGRAASISTPQSPLTPIPMKLNKRRNSYTYGGSLGTTSNQQSGSYLSTNPSSITGEKELFGSLVGSYEESILNGRMSTFPSKPITFVAQIGVLGKGKCKPSLRCPPHINVVFPAYFYELQDDDSPTPYVGTVDLDGFHNTKGYAYNGLEVEPTEGAEDGKKTNKKCHGYRVPPKGQLQVVVKNPNKTAVKLFLCPYDLSDMPAGTKTFLRQKSYKDPPTESLETSAPPAVHTTSSSSVLSAARQYVAINGSLMSNSLPPTPPRSMPTVTPVSKKPAKQKASLRYAIHLQFTCPKEGRIYLSRAIRIVFSHRVPDGSEKLRVVTEGPGNPKYVGLSSVNSRNGPGSSVRGRRGSRVREIYFDEIERGKDGNTNGTLGGRGIDMGKHDEGDVEGNRSRIDGRSDDDGRSGVDARSDETEDSLDNVQHSI